MVKNQEKDVDKHEKRLNKNYANDIIKRYKN